MTEHGKDPIPDAIREQAATWLARNEGDNPEGSQSAFRDWLERDLRHRLAYAEAERAWRESLSLANTHVGRDRILTRAPLHMRRTTHLAAISLVVLLGVGLVSVQFARDLPMFAIGTQVEARTFQTQPGETRTWQLSDGTALTLSGASLARSQFDAGTRRIELEQGRARIRVAGNDARVLVVHAAGLSLSTHAGAFDVSSVASAGKIEVLSGEVQAKLPDGELRSLTAGQGLAVPQAATPAPTALETKSNTSMDGAGEVTIGDAVQQLNRHNAVQIRLVDHALASKRLAGGFRVDDPDAFVAAVSAIDNVEVERFPGSILLKSR